MIKLNKKENISPTSLLSIERIPPDAFLKKVTNFSLIIESSISIDSKLAAFFTNVANAPSPNKKSLISFCPNPETRF